jgi:UDP-glucose 4-epimerase
MKVLITGGSGFIGSHIADRLVERGDEVLAVDNFATGRRDNLLIRDGLELAEGSVADPDFIDAQFARFEPEVVIHAAASYKDPNDWVGDSITNVAGTAAVTNASVRHGVRRFMYFQTALCYGLHPDTQPITIDHELRPWDSSYAISKTAGEAYIRMSGLDFMSFRLANGYGPRNISGPLPTFFQRLSNGQQCFVMDTRRDFVFVDDLVDVVVRAGDGEGDSGEYHISSGSDYSILELFNATVEAMGVELDEEVEVRERHPDDAYSILLDPSKTSNAFPGWEANFDLEAGVKRAVRYYMEFGIDQTFTHLETSE